MTLFAFYAVCVVAAALLAVLLLRRFAAPGRVGVLVLLTTWYCWLTSLSVVALVPLDVFTTLSGDGHDHYKQPITVLWKISYWSTQVLTWALIPIVQGYVLSGAFTAAGRAKSALKRLWRFWLVVGCLAGAGVGLAAAWGKLDVSTLPQLIITISNTYGLVAVVALLGYGLVEVPRVLWRRSFPEKRLLWHLHRVGKSATRLEEASKELERCLSVVIITSQQVSRGEGDLRRKVESLVAYVDATSPVTLGALVTSKVDVESLEERDLDYASNAAGLAKLRGRVKLAVAEFIGSRGDYLSFVKKAMELEAVCKSRQLEVYQSPDGRIGWVAGTGWWYKCVARPYVQKLMALSLAALSMLVVWCEATIGSGRKPDLSPFSLAIHDNTVLGSPFAAQLLVALPLAYVCAATYFSLFKLGTLGPYHMVPHATWSWSLLLNGSLLARFAAPLAFNYLHVIRMTGLESSGHRMAFVNLMRMEDVPLLGAGFNTWFPMVMVVYVGILTLNICESCAAKLLIPARLRFNGECADDEHTSRGQALMLAEHTAVGGGGELGEGTAFFGMAAPPESVVRSRWESNMAAGAGRIGPNSPLRASAPARSLEMGSSTGMEAAAQRQPLFGGAARSDAGPLGGVLRSASRSASPDAADQLFAGVGRGRKHTRGAWD